MELDTPILGVESKQKLLFYDTASPLEQISAFNVAVQLIFIELSSVCKDFQTFTQFHAGWVSNYETRENSSHALPVPKKIILKISEDMRSIVQNLSTWVCYHFSLIDRLINRLPGELSQYLVWKWNGAVDYGLTAQNLINSDKLSDQDRIKMMCTYCLESELKKNYELFEAVRDRMEDEDFYGDNHVFYWYIKMNDNKPVILEDYDEDRLSERFMLGIQSIFNSRALVYYFFQLLQSDEESAYEFCQNELLTFDCFTVKSLIMTMSEQEQIKLFELIAPFRIIDRFVEDSCPHYALQLWNHLKDSMPGEQFIIMMKSTILQSDSFGQEYPEWLMELAMDIWSSTPSRLKQFIFQYQDASFIFEWKHWFGNGFLTKFEIFREGKVCDFYRDDTLLLKVLTDADAKLRRRLWVQEWDQMIICSRPGFLRRLMFICLQDLQEIREYESKIRNSEYTLMYLGKIFKWFSPETMVTFNQFFDFFASESNQRKKLKMMVIEYIYQMPIVFKRSSLALNGIELNRFLEFFHDVDQCSKDLFILKLLYLFKQEKDRYDSPSIVFDNISLIANCLYDPAHMSFLELLKINCRGMDKVAKVDEL